MKKSISIFLTVIVLISTVPSPVAVAAAQPQEPTNDGMIGVPTGNVHANPNVDLPQQALDKVQTNKHANTLKVDFIQKKNGDVAVRATDNANHDGRTLALPADALKTELGFKPKLITVTHESGEQYQTPAEYHNGKILVPIDHFSTNTISFSGEVNVSATSVDGSTYKYNISNLDSVDNYNINVTGTTSSETDTESGSGINEGESFSVHVAGTENPTDEQVSLQSSTNSYWEYKGTDTFTTVIVDSGGNVLMNLEKSGGYGVIEKLQFNIDPSNSDNNVKADIYMSDKKFQNTDSWTYLGTHTFDGDTKTEKVNLKNHFPANGSSVVSIKVANADGNIQGYMHDGSDNDIKKAGLVSSYTPHGGVVEGAGDVTVALPDGSSKTFNNVDSSSWTTESTQLSKDTNTFDVNSIDGNVPVSWESTYTEHTTTKDPKISVNGNETSYTGTLNDGETISLHTNTSWVKEGENKVVVKLPSLSSDAPALSAELSYNHDATDKKSVDYTASKWTESYNISHTYADATDNTETKIPFESNIISVETVEKRVNGGDWQSVSNYKVDGTTLIVDTGDVASGDKVDVRATAQKVNVHNGKITVTKPTDPGDTLDTTFEIKKWGSDSYIEVTDTTDSDRVNYVYNESWNSPEDRSVITSSGNQKLKMPNAGSGATATVTTSPLKVSPDTGEVSVEVLDAGKPFKFEVRHGDSLNDEVEYVYHDTVSGEKYILYSITNGVVRDSDTANSPVYLTDDDTNEVLKIFVEDDSSSSDGDGGGGGFTLGPVQQPTSNDNTGGTALILAVGVGLLAGLYFLQRRLFDGANGRILGVIPRSPLFLVGGGLISIVVIDVVSGNVITRAVGAGLKQIMPVIGIIGAGLAAYWFYKRFIKGQDTNIIVQGGKIQK